MRIPDAPFYRPAIPLTLSLMAGIILGQGLPGLAVMALVIVLAVVIWLVFRLRREHSARWSPLLATLAAGYLAMVPWTSPPLGPDHIADYLDTGYWRIHGVVVDSPVVRFGRTRVVLDVTTLVRDDRTHAVRGRIRLTVMGEATLAPGDRLIFPARIRPFRNFRNPGSFDYRRHMAFKDIHGSAWVSAEKLRRNGSDTRSPVNRLIDAARGRLGQMIDSAAGESHAEEKAVLKALVFGDRSGIDDGLRERFNRAGVGHLLAISGLHAYSAQTDQSFRRKVTTRSALL